MRGGQQLDLSIRQQPPYRKHTLEGYVASIYLPRAGRCGEIAPVREGHVRMCSAERQTGGELEAVYTGTRLHLHLHCLAAVPECCGIEREPREGDAFSTVI